VLATLARPRGSSTVTTAMITDRRQRDLTVSTVERRLHRVEAALLPAFVGSRFVPRSGSAGATVTISGTNFDIGSVIVRFGEVTARTVTVAPTRITATVPPGIATEGVEVDPVLSVENAVGRVDAGVFGVLPTPLFAAPGAQFEPTTGVAGDPITLHGDNLNLADLEVSFAGKRATVVGTPAARQMRVTVPADLVPVGQASALVKISLTRGDKTATSDDDFQATR
jgi:hypothetical protein